MAPSRTPPWPHPHPPQTVSCLGMQAASPPAQLLPSCRRCILIGSIVSPALCLPPSSSPLDLSIRIRLINSFESHVPSGVRTCNTGASTT